MPNILTDFKFKQLILFAIVIFMYCRPFLSVYRFYFVSFDKLRQTYVNRLLSGFRRGVMREIWQSVQGDYVFNLTSSSEYQENPKIKDILNHFDAHIKIADNYGQRLTTFYRVSFKLFTTVVNTGSGEVKVFSHTYWHEIPDRAVRVRALVGVIVLFSWARHFTLIYSASLHPGV